MYRGYKIFVMLQNSKNLGVETPTDKGITLFPNLVTVFLPTYYNPALAHDNREMTGIGLYFLILLQYFYLRTITLHLPTITVRRQALDFRS